MQIKSACRSAPAGFFYILKFVMILAAGHGIMSLWRKMELWIAAGVLIVVLLVMRDQYFIWRLVMAFKSAVFLGGAFYIRKKPLQIRGAFLARPGF